MQPGAPPTDAWGQPTTGAPAGQQQHGQPAGQQQYGQPAGQQQFGQPAGSVGAANAQYQQQMQAAAQPQQVYNPYASQAQPAMIPVGQPGMMMQTWPATSAMTALILGIVGLVMCGCLTAIPGLFVAYSAKTIVDQSPGHPDKGTTTAALVINWIVVGGTLLIGGIYAIIIMFAIIAEGSGV